MTTATVTDKQMGDGHCVSDSDTNGHGGANPARAQLWGMQLSSSQAAVDTLASWALGKACD